MWGARYTTDIDIQKNQVEIIVPNKARFEAAMRRADTEMTKHTRSSREGCRSLSE